MSCNNSCSTCDSACAIKCPKCGLNGLKVNLETIKAQVKKDDVDYNAIATGYMCTSRKCDVVYYFDTTPIIYTKDDLKRKIWFKSPLNEYIVCYCHNILLLDLVNIVKNSEDDNLTKEKIFKILNIDEETTDCLHKNPLGAPCDKVFKNAIDYAYKQKKG